MKVIFLDIDGVLNTDEHRKMFSFDFISPRLVKTLKKIVDSTNAKIVLSSTWRLNFRDKNLVEIALGEMKLHDCTKEFVHQERSKEINDWIANNKVEKVAIIDDMPDADIGHSFFQTNDDFGLTEDIADKIIKHLNKE